MPLYRIGDKFLRQLRELKQKQDNTKGAGVTNRPLGITISPTAPPGRQQETIETRLFSVVSFAGLSGGVYLVDIYRWRSDSAVFNPNSQFVTTNEIDSAATKERAYVGNIAESGFNTHRIGVGVFFICWSTPRVANDGKRLYLCNYNHALRWWRVNTTTNKIQGSYQDAESIGDVTSWVDLADVDPCT